MESNNLFLNIYRRKSTEDLIAVALNEDCDENSRLTAIAVLKEKDNNDLRLSEIEKRLTEKVHNHQLKEISDDRYSTVLDRLGSNFIDGIVISLLAYLIKILHLTNGIESLALLSIIGFFGSVFPYLYTIIFHTAEGQTIGKMVMRIKVFDKSEKKVISFPQAFLRDSVPIVLIITLNYVLPEFGIFGIGFLLAVIKVMSVLMIAWSLLEVITVLFNRKRRAIHDFIAGTVVLKLN